MLTEYLLRSQTKYSLLDVNGPHMGHGSQSKPDEYTDPPCDDLQYTRTHRHGQRVSTETFRVRLSASSYLDSTLVSTSNTLR
jgi:hypothetical protein